MPSECASDCNTPRRRKEFAAGATHQRLVCGPGTCAVRCRSIVPQCHFATAIQERLVGHEYPSPCVYRKPNPAMVSVLGSPSHPLATLCKKNQVRPLSRGRSYFLRSPWDRFGTLLPFLRASERPMAIACFRLVTFFPLLPLLSVPRLRLRIARSTSFEEVREYRRAIHQSSRDRVSAHNSPGILPLRFAHAVIEIGPPRPQYRPALIESNTNPYLRYGGTAFERMPPLTEKTPVTSISDEKPTGHQIFVDAKCLK
jgi:hypothetical protein